MKIVVYEPQSGLINITQQGGVDKGVIGKYHDQGYAASEVRDLPTSIDDVYVRDGKVAKRPILKARINKNRIRADGMDEAKITGVPAGAHVRVLEGLSGLVQVNEFVADGNTIHIVAKEPALHQVIVEDFPHADQQFVIEAV